MRNAELSILRNALIGIRRSQNRSAVKRVCTKYGGHSENRKRNAERRKLHANTAGAADSFFPLFTHRDSPFRFAAPRPSA